MVALNTQMTSDNLKLVDFCFPGISNLDAVNSHKKTFFSFAGMTPMAWEFGQIFQDFPFLQKAPE